MSESLRGRGYDEIRDYLLADDEPPPPAGPEDYGLPTNVDPARANDDVLPLMLIDPARWRDAPPPRRWHVRGLIPAGVPTILSGDGGAGKSLIAMQLAASTAANKPWLGREVRPGRALYLGAEDDEDEMHRRLVDIAADINVGLNELSKLRLISLASEDDAIMATIGRDNVLQTTAVWRQFEAIVADWRPALIIADPIIDLFAGDEIRRAQVRQFVRLFRQLCIRFNLTVILISHPSLAGIATGSGLSGSTDWNNAVRSRLYLQAVKDEGTETDPTARVLRVVKANYGPAGAEIFLNWRAGVFVATDKRPGSLAAEANKARAEAVFVELIEAYNAEGRPVSAKPSANYAPTVFARDCRSNGAGKKALIAAMNTLFNAGRIKTVDVGPPSKRRSKLVLAEPPKDFAS